MTYSTRISWKGLARKVGLGVGVATVLGLCVGRPVEGSQPQILEQVSTYSGEDVSGVEIRLSGYSVHRVIPLDDREMLVAFKDTDLAEHVYERETVVGDRLVEKIENAQSPSHVARVVVRTVKPFSEIEYRIRENQGVFRIELRAKDERPDETAGQSSEKTASAEEVAEKKTAPAPVGVAHTMEPNQTPVPGIDPEISATIPVAGSGESGGEKALPGMLLAMQDSDLRLIGTALMSDSHKSIAILESGDSGLQKACREGDRLGETLIKKIFYERVIITTGQGDIVLLMGRGYARAGPPSPFQSVNLERQEIDSAFPDYEGLMQAMRFRAYFEGGRPYGFVIYNIKPGSIFERMGIENGDIIVNVNGEAFKTTQPVVEFFRALKEEQAISLGVKRGDSTQALRVEVL